MKTQLTKEQSQRLIELGVPKEKASLQVLFEEDGPFDIWNEDILSRPIFTLTDLLEILPREIEDCPIEIIWEQKESKWNCIYAGLISQMSEELIDALYRLTVWCIKNKHIVEI